jgi:hypothetical protein
MLQIRRIVSQTVFSALFRIFFFVINTCSAETPWRQSDFIIGTHVDPCLSDNNNPPFSGPADTAELDNDRYNYQVCKNAYFNLLSGHNHLWDGHPCDVPVVHGQEKTDYALRRAADVGLKSFVHHEPWESCNCNAAFLSFMRAENTTPYHSYKNYAAFITSHYKNIGARQYAALQGFFAAAEPGPGQTTVSCGSDGFTHGIDTMKIWISAFKSCCPEKQSHVFIFPSGAALLGTFSDSNSYKAYIDTVFNDADSSRRPQVVCSNSYPLFDPGLHPIEKNFFWGLNTYRIKAGNRPFWNYAHCVFTFRDGDVRRDPEFHTYVPPDEATLRWNAFTNVAHGAKGIIWFSYVSSNKNLGTYGNYGDAVVDCRNASPLIAGSNPQRTEYSVIREINRYCACIVGPAVMTSDFVNTYHKKKSGPDAHGNCTVFPRQSYIPACQILQTGASDPVLHDLNNRNVMAGVFRDRLDTSLFNILLVNKQWKLRARPVVKLHITLKGDLENRASVAPRAYRYDGKTAYTRLPVSYDPQKNLSDVTLPDTLLSGEARMIKVTAAGRSPPRLTGFRPHGEIAATQNNIDKKLICFARGTDDKIYARIQDTADVDFWGTGWRLIDTTRINGTIACANFGNNGRICLFSTTADGHLQYTCQSRPQDKTKPLLFNAWKTVAMANKIDGHIVCSLFGTSKKYLAVFFTSGRTLYYGYFDDAFVYHGTYTVAGADSINNGSLALGRNIQGMFPGSIDLFFTKSNGRVHRGRLTASGMQRHSMPAFADFGCSAAGAIVVGTNANSTLEVFFVNQESGRLFHKRQRSPGSSEWDSYDEQVKVYGWLSVGRNSDGRLELFAKDTAGYLCHAWQETANGPRLSLFVRLGAGSVTVGAGPAAVCSNGDGRMTVFAVCDGNANIFFSSQCVSGSGSDWQNCQPFTNLSDQDR